MAPLRRVFAPLRNRQFALLWGGQSVSLLGDGVLGTAMPILVLTTAHGTAGDLGIVIAARMLPLVVFLLLGGAITDRVSKRLAMLASDTVRGVVTLALGVVAVQGDLSMAWLVTGSLIMGTASALFLPASTAMLPEIVARDALMQANSLTQMSRNLAASLIGPILGGVIAAVAGAPVALFFDAGTFAVSASCLFMMRPTPVPPARSTSMLADVRAGLGFCRRTPWLIWTLVVAGVANAVVFSPFALMVPLLFKEVLSTPVWMIGVGFSCFGLGGLLGALIAGAMGTPRRPIRTMWLCWIVAALVDVGFGLAPTAVVACVALVCIGPLMMVGNIIWESLIQREVPSDLLGRVSSVDWTISLAGAPIGVAAAGAVAGSVGVRPAIVVPALVVAAGSLLVLLLLRPLTEIDRRVEVAAG